MAVREQRRALNEQLAIVDGLRNLKVKLDREELDHIPWLDKIIVQLNARQFPDQGLARLAEDIIQVAHKRRLQVIQNNNNLLRHSSPEVRTRINRFRSTL
tara:strand:+ start:191 stop:490 length:300 start_codon:yes stop_codon:yes gene_type:complete